MRPINFYYYYRIKGSNSKKALVRTINEKISADSLTILNLELFKIKANNLINYNN